MSTVQKPNQSDQLLARTSRAKLLEQVSQRPGRRVEVVFSQFPNEAVTLPSRAIELLLEGLEELGKGNGIQLFPIEAELTTQQASELLNLSRPYVVRLLDEGKIPSTRVGTHRRVRLRDLMAYKKKSDADRAKAMKSLVAEAQELDMGY